MSIEMINFAVQIAAGLAVVASLIFVGVQIQLNTRATQLAAVQAVQSAIGRTEELIIQDQTFAEILKHGLTANPGDLPDTDRIRLNVFYRHTLRTYQSAYYQFTKGALEASVWEPQARALAAIFRADRGFRGHFKVEKYMLHPSFSAFCESLLSGEYPWVITSASEPVPAQD